MKLHHFLIFAVVAELYDSFLHVLFVFSCICFYSSAPTLFIRAFFIGCFAVKTDKTAVIVFVVCLLIYKSKGDKYSSIFLFEKDSDSDAVFDVSLRADQ